MAQDGDTIVRLAKKNLKRVLGAKELFAVGYGDVGSSIYYALGATALYALGATPLALALAGIVFICTALTYAELSSTFPEPGGAATFTRYAFNDLISFIAGWGLLLDYIVTLAISAFTVPPYFKHFLTLFSIQVPDTFWMHTGSASVVILILLSINWIGMKHSGFLSFLLAMFTLLSQAVIVILGALFLLNIPFLFEHMRIVPIGTSWSPDWWQFLRGVSVAMVAYTGIEAIAQLAAETKNPGIAIPKAIRWTVFVVLFLYLGMSLVGLSVLSPTTLGTEYIEDPVLGIVLQFPVGGALLGPWIGLIAAIILFIAANAGLIGCSRLTFSMGQYYQVPNFFFRLHPRFRTPHISLTIFSLLAIGILFLSRNRMLFLVDLYNVGAQLAFFAAHLSLLILRYKKREVERPYKAPLNISFGKKYSLSLTALLGALVSFSVWILVIVTKPEGRQVGLLWISLGLIMYMYYRKKKKIPATAQTKIEEVKIPGYRPIEAKKVLVVARFKGGTDALQLALQLASTHKASVTAIYVLEVPYSIPMDAPLLDRERHGEEALKRAEAVAREYHTPIELNLVRSRSLEEALLDVAAKESFDWIVMGIAQGELRHRGGFALQAEKLLKEAPCHVLFCQS